MQFETIKSEMKYKGRVFDLRRDQVRLPDGQVTELDIVEHNGAVTLVPVDAEHQIWLVRQYRHAAGIELLELPAGGMELDEDIFECAQRELREEIGMTSGVMEKVGAFYLAPGYSTEFMHIFLARELSPAPLPGDIDEVLNLEKYPISEVYEMVSQGDIQDAKSLAALFLVQPILMNL
jgi:ADP-ribose pyrophosphatase